MIKEKLGRGRYSEVYHGLNLLTNQDVVIKLLKPINMEKIKKEIFILKELRQCKNITNLHEVVIDPPTQTPSLVNVYSDFGLR